MQYISVILWRFINKTLSITKIESVLEKILNIIERLSAIIQGVIVFLVFLFLHLLL